MDNQITHYEQAVDDLFTNQLHDTALSDLKTTPRKHLILYYMTLGQRVRILYNMWQNAELVASTGTDHPDDASMFIIVKLWELLQVTDIPILLNARKPSAAEHAATLKLIRHYESVLDREFTVK